MEGSIEYAAAVTTIIAMMLSLVTALLLGLFFRKKWRNCDVYPPGAATMVDHILNFKRIHDFFYDRHQRFKTFRIAYPTFSMVCTTDPADVEHMLKTNFANYIKVSSLAYTILLQKFYVCTIVIFLLEIFGLELCNIYIWSIFWSVKIEFPS